MKKRTIKTITGLIIAITIISPVLAQAIFTFDRSLKVGMTGTDIKQLQILLNRDIDTRVADFGVGSPGQETSFFGSLTKIAVIRFQEKYAEDVLLPWGMTKGTGFIGRTTRQKLSTFFSEEEKSSFEGLADRMGDRLATFVFERNLKVGMTGIDIKQLQILLNRDVDTRVADFGVGSPGQETSFFGSLTKIAVIRFQEKYAEDVLLPWGMTKGTGFIGRTTKQKLNFISDKLKIVLDEQREIIVYTPGEPSSVRVEGLSPGLTVALTSNSFANTELIAGQSLASLAEFTFINGDNKEIKITQLRFKRIGASANTTLAKVYLFAGIKRLTTGTSALSTGVISFADATGIITIPAGGLKTITVKSDLATSTNSEIVGISIQAENDIISDATSINGIFPINSNLMAIRSVTLAEVDFNSTTTPATNTSIASQNGYPVWQNTISIPTKAVKLTYFNLKESGSIDRSNLRNFRLYVNSVSVGSVVESLDEDGFVIFDLSNSSQKLEIGYSTIRVSADIIDGSSKNFKFSLETAADASFIDSEYGVNVLPTANSSTFSARTSGVQTVSTGGVTIVRKAGSPDDVINGISAQTIGEFTMTATGERIKIESLEVEVLWVEDSGSTTVASLRDGMILINGVQMGSATDIDVDATSSDGSGTSYNFSSSLVLEPGESVTLTIKADIYDNDGTNNLENDDTLQVNILAGSSNAEGLVSRSAISVPASDVTGQAVELEQGTLSLAKYAAFPSKTHVVPITVAKIAHFTLMGSSESINLNNITVNLATVAGAVDASDDLSNLYVVYGGNSTSVKQAVVDGDNSWPIIYQLDNKTDVLEIMIYADVALSAFNSSTTDTITPKLTVNGISIESGASAASSQATGQTITFDIGEEGDLTGQMAGDSPLDRIVAGNSTVIGAKFEFRAVNDDFLLKTIRITLDQDSGGDAAGAILYAVLKDGEEVILDKNGQEARREPGAGKDAAEIEFTGLKIAIPAGTSKVLTFDLVLDTPSSDISPATSQANLRIELEKIKYENSLGTSITDKKPGPANNDPDANHLYVYKSIPTFTHIDLGSNNKIYNGSSTKLYSFKIKADPAGDITFKQLKFGLNWSTDNSSNLALDTFRLKKDSQDITSIVTIQDSLGNSLESIINTVTLSHSVVVFTFDTEEKVLAGQEKTYDVYARPSGFKSTTNGTDTVVINLKGGSDESSHNGSNRYLVDNATTGLFALNSTNSGDGTAYNVIWSDISSIQHSSLADNAYSDWANSYLVLNLPLDGEAWQGQ